VIRDVPWGRYQVQLERPGHQPREETISVDRPDRVEYTFRLEPLVPPTASVSLSAVGYWMVGGVQAALSFGILTSEYAVEMDGQFVIDWRIRAQETMLQVAPGVHRLRVLTRTMIGREPQVFHDTMLELVPASKSNVIVDFYAGDVTVNGKSESFNGAGVRIGK
jgi:hypothetical protein